MWWRKLAYLFLCSLLASCGFHLQGPMPLVQQLHTLYLQAADPYGQLEKSLRDYLKQSQVQLVEKSELAKTELVILQDEETQELLSVNATQQTRQYNLHVNVAFEITDNQGNTIVNSQKLTETRTLTMQSNTVLGSSNEATLYYQQMRRSLAIRIMNILSSGNVSQTVSQYFSTQKSPHHEN